MATSGTGLDRLGVERRDEAGLPLVWSWMGVTWYGSVWRVRAVFGSAEFGAVWRGWEWSGSAGLPQGWEWPG